MAVSVAAAPAPEAHPVCIVGAGPAGLMAANGLEAKGYSTVIFEKDPEVGGKCQEYYEGNTFHPMGALVFPNSTMYTETYKVVSQSGLPNYPFGYDGKPWLFDWQTGDVVLAPSSQGDLYPEMESDIDRYIQFWNANISSNWGSIGYKDGIPLEYTVSIGQWLTDNGYGALFINIFEEGMVPYGYGDISETPALILAFPPVIDALEAAHLDITSEENEVFSPVGTTKYWSGAVNVAIPPGSVYGAAVFEAEGQPAAVVSLFNTSSIATTWSWGKYRSNQTDEEAKELLISTISKFNKDPNNATQLPIPITEEDVRDFGGWDYFPHYDTQQLQEGFYGKFDALQGHKNTYYASGLNAFEIIEFALRAGQDVAASYF
ncbi:hypothetical protein PHLCEN_2v6093 [Hermanssonia centrifuga]|uniref:Uncharacterized protein n=1 Tax=Hermanssonia centrifuga TaxID=98765 RepID=A0A2R6P0G2_9APHY|nr:hypothetical protein PHLCEN_2v6093 [Hermanssonia centrifuga]